jgi:flagellar hook assembly protein FlgD
VRINIYDYSGKTVFSLNQGKQEEGVYQIDVYRNNLSSGIYFYSLEINGLVTDCRKMIIIN